MPKHSISKPASYRYAGQEKVRRCLDCRHEFRSTWWGERICPTCKRLPEDVRVGRGLNARTRNVDAT